jgi:hypothetical protein
MAQGARGEMWYFSVARCRRIVQAVLGAAPPRAALLNQIGLSGVAEWDLRSIQAPVR